MIDKPMTPEEQRHEEVLWAIANVGRFSIRADGRVAIRVECSSVGTILEDTATETVRAAMDWHKKNVPWD